MGLSAAALGMGTADKQMQAVLDALASLGPKPIESLTAQEARKQPTPKDAVMAVLKKEGRSTAPEPVGKVEDRSIPGADGQLPVRIYWPKGDGPFPVVVYFHGGGWVIANKDVYDATPRALTNLANCIVVSVDYRQGPEHRFPSAHDDANAAWKWTTEHARDISGDPQRLAVAGESAGGNLAVTVAMHARDAKTMTARHVLSVYPIAGADTNTESYRENAMAKPLNKAMMEWFFKNYLRSEADRTDPRIDLVHADLAGLPSTTIVTDQIDPLRSEGEMLADRLKKAGVDVEHRNYDGVTHEFFSMSAVVTKAKDANQFAADRLKASLGRR
jgi:acetyl esterase/lipase